MINKDELIFVVDEDNNPVDPLPRHEVHKRGLWHRTTGVWVVNDKRQVLCQKRSLKKDQKPGFWEAFLGGHLAPGEEYADNAVAETTEEIGVKINYDDLKQFKILKSDSGTHKEFQGIFGIKLNNKIEDFPFEVEEIDKLEWVSFKKLSKILLRDKESKWVRKPWDGEVLEWLQTF